LKTQPKSSVGSTEDHKLPRQYWAKSNAGSITISTSNYTTEIEPGCFYVQINFIIK
jgi:hypothetical protein